MDADAKANANADGSTIALRERCSGELKMDVKIDLSTWLINYSSDVSKDRVQRSMATIVTSGMKNPPKKLIFSMFCLDFGLCTLISKK